MPEEEIQSLRKEIPYLYLFDKRNLFEFSSWVKENIDSASFEILRIMIQKKIQIAVLDPHPVYFLFHDRFAKSFKFINLKENY